jgi:anaerobic selenocysteine-containing dehydrogenase
VNREALEMPSLQQTALGREARLVNMAQLGRALNELDSPPVQALVVYNSNPGAIAPDQAAVRRGLAREDLFTVVLEQFLTDTAAWADIVLPATTFLEHTDLYFAYGHYYLQLARAALPAPGECRSNVEIFRALAGKMGFDDACFGDSDDDMIRTLLDTDSEFLRGVTLERLDREGFVRLSISAAGEPFLPFAQGFPLPEGRCDLDATALDYTPPQESRLGEAAARGRYPLELVSSKFDDAMNSTFGHRDEVDAACAVVHLHPGDAAPRGIETGAEVRVYNARGALRLPARVAEDVRPGVVRIPSVRWPRRDASGWGVNLLTADRLTDIGGGPTFYNCLVEVEKCV